MLITLQFSNQTTNKAIKILNNKYLVYLGTISYGIYMIHGLIWWAMRQSLNMFLNFQYFKTAGALIKFSLKTNIVITYTHHWATFNYLSISYQF